MSSGATSGHSGSSFPEGSSGCDNLNAPHGLEQQATRSADSGTRRNQILAATRDASLRVGGQLSRKAAHWCSKVVDGRRRRRLKRTGNWKREGGKRMLASSLVGKLTQYMIKKKNSSERAGGRLSDSAQTAAKNTPEVPRTAAAGSATADAQQVATGGASRHLISELAWRLVKRCSERLSGAHSAKALQSEISGGSSNDNKRCNQPPEDNSGAACAGVNWQDSSSSSSMATPQLRPSEQAVGAGGLQAACINSSTSTLSIATTTAAAACSNNGSASPPATTCCYCDETSSSGFVSGGGGGAGSAVATNCSDSITTHSCSSSTCNELSPAVQQNEGSPSTDANNNSQAKPTELKKKSSFLRKARESTMNLASLATVTQRFGSSASAGNIWSPSSAANNQRRELAELAGDSEAVRPLDYSARAAFDQDEPGGSAARPHESSMDSGIQIVAPKGAAPKVGLTPAKTSGSPASKEKKRRQKEAEKVEKLRLLVSYLRSGSSQQLLTPVTLEAEELELAERYKSHLILCEDCLQAAEKQVTFGLTPNLSSSSLTAPILPNNSSGERLARSRTPDAPSTREPTSATNDLQLNTIAGIVINVRRSSDQTLGQQARDNYLSPRGSPGAGQLSVSQQNVSQSSSAPSIDEPHLQAVAGEPQESGQLCCSKCNKLTGRNKNSLTSSLEIGSPDIDSKQPTIAHNQTDAQLSHQQPATNRTNNQDLLQSADGSGPQQPNSHCQQSTNNNHPHDFKEDHFNHQQHSFHYQPDNEQISLSSDRSLSGGSENGATQLGTNHSSTAVARPASAQNLATWIDNEVNSLVNDLEAKSQLVENEKYMKSSKRKWLTGSNRRNSSGAHST